MEITHDKFEEIAKTLEVPELWLEVSSDWRKTNGNDTAQSVSLSIRQALGMKLIQLVEHGDFHEIEDKTQALQQITSLLKTRRPFLSTFASASISHCPIAGGFAIIAQPMQVGFDVEDRERFNDPSAVMRMSTPDEFQSAPDPGSLWVAKESAFKALLGSDQPKVLSEVVVGEWQHCSEGLFCFQFSSNQSKHLGPRGRGTVLHLERLILGLSII